MREGYFSPKILKFIFILLFILVNITESRIEGNLSNLIGENKISKEKVEELPKDINYGKNESIATGETDENKNEKGKMDYKLKVNLLNKVNEGKGFKKPERKKNQTEEKKGRLII
jgi:hypothetical protein